MPDKSTFMRMREDEREIRKTLIINAAMILFERMPFQDIGMRDIAAEAGVSAASIYRYFPSRDDLFAEALIRDMIIVEQRFGPRAAAARDLRSRVATVLRRSNKRAQRHIPYAQKPPVDAILLITLGKFANFELVARRHFSWN